MEFNVTGKDGALTKYTITGMDFEQAEALVKSVTTYKVRQIEGGLEGSCNKKEIAKISELVEKAAKNVIISKPAAQAKKPATGRYVELLEVAEREGLNHGKAWICGERDIETKGAHPAWESEMICYVYAS